MFRAALVLSLLPILAAAAPEGELVREEAYNYRVVGRLPAGWKRRGRDLVFTYTLAGIPHAYIHFVRQRLKADVDTEAEVRRRDKRYHFPDAPKEAGGRVSKTTWGDLPAVLYEFEARVQGTRCLRRVRALCLNKVWYECIETVYGDKTETEDDGCREGLALFATGFRVLVKPLPQRAAGTDPPAVVRHDEYGYALPLPKRLALVAVDPAKDPGCRVAMESTDKDPRHRLRVRLFEYGTHREFDPMPWLDSFYGGFGGLHTNAKRVDIELPGVTGGRCLAAVRFSGVRDEQPVRTDIYLVRSDRDQRVFVLRIRQRGDAPTVFAPEIRAILTGFRLLDS